MSVTLRLTRLGQKKRPFYRVVATEKQAPRDGRFLDVVGFYNPMTSPPTVSLKEDKVRRWLDCGARTSLIVHNLIKKQIPGLLEGKIDARKAKIVASRQKRKQREADRAKA